MMTFPSLPNWDGIHPAMVQFPVALLLTAPLLLLVSLFVRREWQGWVGSALVLMALGTVAAWFAVGSGHAAGQLVDKVQGLDRAILRHEALGTATRNLFTLLTVVLALVLLLPGLAKKPLTPAWRIGTHAVFLALYLVATMTLANTAMQGGQLVHEYGVRAMVQERARIEATPVAEAPPAPAPSPVTKEAPRN